MWLERPLAGEAGAAVNKPPLLMCQWRWWKRHKLDINNLNPACLPWSERSGSVLEQRVTPFGHTRAGAEPVFCLPRFGLLCPLASNMPVKVTKDTNRRLFQSGDWDRFVDRGIYRCQIGIGGPGKAKGPTPIRLAVVTLVLVFTPGQVCPWLQVAWTGIHQGIRFPWRECKRVYRLWVRPLSVNLPKRGREGGIGTDGLTCTDVCGGPGVQGPSSLSLKGLCVCFLVYLFY